MTEARAWRMFAQHQCEVVDGREYMHFGEEPWVRGFFGGNVREVQLIEDPNGQYYGWVRAGEGEPTIIQPHSGMFEMQFPYGSRAEVARGKGEVVRMRVEAVSAA